MTEGHFQEHFSSQFNQELGNLRSRVLAMGDAVEKQLVDAVAALETRNDDMARTVIGGDLHVNALEVYLDDECRRILARRQPAAGDLRLVFTVIKAVTDLERIGDSAKSVARMTIKIGELGLAEPLPSLKHLGDLVGRMVHNALRAFSGMNVDIALEVERADIEADLEYQTILQTLKSRMSERPRVIEGALHLLSAARAIERAGDHAKNICEYVIYLVQGQDTRYVSIEDRERQVQSRAARPEPGANPPKT